MVAIQITVVRPPKSLLVHQAAVIAVAVAVQIQAVSKENRTRRCQKLS
ncbi:Protein of unknown function [Leuconostoc citreum LBAE C11]|nr:Protein of unknown function [Leuconostoc citreum LBAE C11]